MRRRLFLSNAGLSLAATAAPWSIAAAEDTRALPPAASSSEPFASLRGGGPHHLSPDQEAQRVTASAAAPGQKGRWVARAALPLARSEMAWATASRGRMHIVGGYGEGAVNRAYHHIYDPASDRWLLGAPLPRGANHVAVVADTERVYALGGFTEQNRRSDGNAYAYDVSSDRWQSIAPLPRPRGAAAAVLLDGRIHLIGGASEPAAERASVGWHEVYEPKEDRWSVRKALPGARDHVGCVADGGRIHVIGGRFNAMSGAAETARALGYDAIVCQEPIVGDARTMGPVVLDRARTLAAGRQRPVAVIFSGETTVKVVGTGKGGRNQEIALSVAGKLTAESGDIALGSVGTDGIDGPTDAAGAYSDTTTITRAEQQGLDADAFLADNNAYAFFQKIDDLIITGPSTTNVGDLQIVLFR